MLMRTKACSFAVVLVTLLLESKAHAQWYSNPRYANGGANNVGAGRPNPTNPALTQNGKAGGAAALVPQVAGAGAGDVSGNALNTGANALLNGNYIPGGIIPGGGIATGGAAGTSGGAQAASGGDGGSDSDASSGGGGGGGGSAGYQFVSDPVSAETNAVYSGMSNLIRSEGEYNRDTAHALNDFERARTKYIDNQQLLLSARRSMYRARMAYRAEDIEENHASLIRAEQFMATHRPQALSSRHFDASSGRIVWPAALKGEQFADARKELEELLESNAKDSSDHAVFNQIKMHINQLRDALHGHVLSLPLDDYSDARQFLDSLLVSAH